MNRQDVSALSEGQKACLRLVAAGLEAKEIARELDITLSAVNERLRAARELLGLSRSRDAARLLLESEGATDHKRIVAKPFVVGDQPLGRESLPLPERYDAVPEGADRIDLREAQAGFMPASVLSPDPLTPQARAAEEVRNGLSGPERLAKVVEAAAKLATVLCLAFLLAVLVSKAIATH